MKPFFSSIQINLSTCIRLLMKMSMNQRKRWNVFHTVPYKTNRSSCLSIVDSSNFYHEENFNGTPLLYSGGSRSVFRKHVALVQVVWLGMGQKMKNSSPNGSHFRNISRCPLTNDVTWLRLNLDHHYCQRTILPKEIDRLFRYLAVKIINAFRYGSPAHQGVGVFVSRETNTRTSHALN